MGGKVFNLATTKLPFEKHSLLLTSREGETAFQIRSGLMGSEPRGGFRTLTEGRRRTMKQPRFFFFPTCKILHNYPLVGKRERKGVGLVLCYSQKRRLLLCPISSPPLLHICMKNCFVPARLLSRSEPQSWALLRQRYMGTSADTKMLGIGRRRHYPSLKETVFMGERCVANRAREESSVLFSSFLAGRDCFAQRYQIPRNSKRRRRRRTN